MVLTLGIDQGGTKTDIVIADETGRILGYGNDRGHTDLEGERREVRMRRIRYAADRAFSASGLSSPQLSHVYANCNGADWEFEYEVGRKNLIRTLGVPHTVIFNDCMGALRSGISTAGRDCAVICLGSGTNVGIKSRNGEELIYGYFIHDEDHGGGAIGKAVFEAAYDDYIGLGPATVLTPLLLEATGFDDIQELFIATTTGRTEDEKPLRLKHKDYAWLMFEAMRAGDVTANRFVNAFCKRLTKYVVLGAQRMGLSGDDFTVVISGGIVKVGMEIFEILERYIKEVMPGVNCVNARYEPVIGPILYFYDDYYNGSIPDEVLERLDSECIKYGLIRKSSAGLVAKPVRDAKGMW